MRLIFIALFMEGDGTQPEPIWSSVPFGFAINKNDESGPSLRFCAQHILIRVRKIDREERKKQEKIKRKKRGEKNLQLIHNLVSVLFKLLLDLPTATSPFIRIGWLLFKRPFDATHEEKTNNHEQGGEREKKKANNAICIESNTTERPTLGGKDQWW